MLDNNYSLVLIPFHLSLSEFIKWWLMLDYSTKLESLSKEIEGDLYVDQISRILYATDASAYREMPLAVARPKTERDIKKLIEFANRYKITLIPRTAGTSLAGR